MEFLVMLVLTIIGQLLGIYVGLLVYDKTGRLFTALLATVFVGRICLLFEQAIVAGLFPQ